ncbi:B12-binding domain-containing radical SAM protein [bacterium]|nr:B12-binding domain-containing radical SAM protein [candidate division CSSED10-310 bacterium]
MSRAVFLQSLWTENLGPMYLSSVAKAAGHECNLIIETKAARNRDIARLAPDLIAFSVTTGMHQWALRRAAELRKILNVPIVFGGPHATYYPEIIENSQVDAICRGEGETSFVEMLNRLDTGGSWVDISNLWVKYEGIIYRNDVAVLEENLDILPRPDRDLYYRYPYIRNYENKSFISGRGCPYSCTYCSIASLREIYKNRGPFVRFHSPRRVVEEICDVKERFGLRVVIFQDDTFIIGPERLETLLKLYVAEVRLPFVCHVRADLLTYDIARMLKEAGCHSVDFGLESGDETLRREVLGKTVTNDQIRDAASILKQTGIRFRTTNMIGLPGESLEQVYRTVLLNQEIRTDYPSASIYQPYPRTVLGDRAIADGLAGQDFSVDSIGSSFFRTSLIDSDHRKQFINLQKLFWPAVRFPRLMPVIRRIVRLPPNPVFELLFLLFYGINYTLSENVSIRRLINVGRHTIISFFYRTN